MNYPIPRLSTCSSPCPPLLAGLVFLFLGGLWPTAEASHNMAGQITYCYLGGNQYEIMLTTYTDSTARLVDRCYANLEIWGIQGNDEVLLRTIENIPRNNGIEYSRNCGPPVLTGVQLRQKRGFFDNNVKVNRYVTTVDFNPGLYKIRYFDMARVFQVNNMAESGSTTFFVETTLNHNPSRLNCSPQLLNHPIDDACTFKVWKHNPGAWDPDGDSLAFSLYPSQQYYPPNIRRPRNVLNYSFPQVNGGGSFSIDPQTGIVIWDAPQRAGKYSFAILIEEYRRGRLIGEMLQDITVFVFPCSNNPPVIESTREICVQAGDTVDLEVKSWDPDQEDEKLVFMLNNGDQGINGPFAVDTFPARLEFSNPPPPHPAFPERPIYHEMRGLPLDTLRARLIWETACEHVRMHPYQVDYYARDSSINAPILADHFSTLITVRARGVPKPEGIPGSGQIELNWQAHPCTRVVGYEIYRSDSTVSTPVDTICCNGLPEAYNRVGFVRGHDNTEYLDEDLEFREKYCYRVVAIFPDGTRSCPSPDTCLRILRDMPVITHNTIDQTDAQDGIVTVRWVKPEVDRIDANQFPPPYAYQLYRTAGIRDSTLDPVDHPPLDIDQTTWTAGNLDTENQGYNYRVELLDGNGEFVSKSSLASSIYLTAQPINRAIRLVWREYVPWRNMEYIIYRADEPQDPFTELGRISSSGLNMHTYIDNGDPTQGGLPIDEDFCYYIEARGTYNTPGIPDTLINLSNIRCATATDTVPPCLAGPDSFRVDDDCEEFRIRFSWLLGDTLCASDVSHYLIHFSEQPGGPYRELTDQIPGRRNELALDSVEYVLDNTRQQSIKGCYRFSAVDLRGNESPLGPEFCVDNCPFVDIPNTLTPNGDGVNDILSLTALLNGKSLSRSILSVEFSVYDRWGRLIRTSDNPALLWDGTDSSGSLVVGGTYFYILNVRFDNLDETEIMRSGNITILPR